MTEEEWLSVNSPNELRDYGKTQKLLSNVFDHLKSHQFSIRKARLFAVACCRSLEPWLSESECHVAIERSEQFADGLITSKTLAASRKDFPAEKRFRLRSECEHRGFTDALQSLEPNTRMMVWSASWDACHYSVRADAWDAARFCWLAAAAAHECAPLGAEKAGSLRFVLHDIFGNPFRPVAFDRRWRTSDVVGLARAIYDKKAFNRMPILADALMDAGCADEQILGHCRGDGPHVRGCWAVDLVLEKE